MPRRFLPDLRLRLQQFHQLGCARNQPPDVARRLVGRKNGSQLPAPHRVSEAFAPPGLTSMDTALLIKTIHRSRRIILIRPLVQERTDEEYGYCGRLMNIPISTTSARGRLTVWHSRHSPQAVSERANPC